MSEYTEYYSTEMKKSFDCKYCHLCTNCINCFDCENCSGLTNATKISNYSLDKTFKLKKGNKNALSESIVKEIRDSSLMFLITDFFDRCPIWKEKTNDHYTLLSCLLTDSSMVKFLLNKGYDRSLFPEEIIMKIESEN